MNRDRIPVIFALFLVVGGCVLEAANFALRIAFGSSDTPAFYFSMTLMLIGLATLVCTNVARKVAARVDQLERRLAECEKREEALQESLRARVGRLEREWDAARAPADRPKP